MLKYRHIYILLFFVVWAHQHLKSQEYSALDSFNYCYDQKNYSQALNFWKEIDHEEVDYGLLKRKGNCYHYIGNYDSSLQIFQRVLLKLSLEDTLKLIDISINIGNAYQNLSKNDSALHYFSKAEHLNRIYKSMLSSKLYLSIGQLYNEVNLLDSAEYYFLKALDSIRSMSNDMSVSTLYKYESLLKLYLEKGSYEKAIKYGVTAINLVFSMDDPSSWWLFSLHYNIGRVYYSMKSWENAIYYFTKSQEYITDDSKRYEKYVESALMYCYSKTGNALVDSLYYRNDGQTMLKDTMAFAYHLMNYANSIKVNNTDAQILPYYRKAYILLSEKKGFYDKQLTGISNMLGAEFNKLRQYDSSLYYHQHALYCTAKDVDTSDYASNPADVFNADMRLPDIVARKLNTLIAISHQPLNEDSLQNINRLILANCDYYGRCVDAMLRDKTFMQDRLTVLKKEIRKYMLAGIEASWELYQNGHDAFYPEKALQFSETGKYMLLKSMMSARANARRLPDAVAHSNSLLINRINSLQMKIGQREAVGDTSGIADLREALFNLILQKDSLRNVILQQYPETIDRTFNRVNLDMVKKLVGEGQMLNSYFLEDSLLHIIRITGDTMIWIRNDDAAHVREMVAKVADFCNPLGYHTNEKQDYIDCANELNEVLIGDSTMTTGTDEMIIIPDQELNLLPFEALLNGPATRTTSYRDLPYLLHDFTFSYYNSLFLACGNGPEIQSPRNGFLAVAPDFRDSASTSRSSLSSIEQASGEAGYLADLFDGELLAGHQANRKNLEQHLNHSSIIHFATHTNLDTTGFFNSGLLLAGDSTGSNYESLHTSDICCMDMPADLVMLSCCNSGNGLLLDGEGVISLGWAFRYAGCRSVGISLFPLDDATARSIMTSFYAYLKKGKSKNTALRQAKLDFLETSYPGKTHPKYWAGITIFGDQQNVAGTSGFFTRYRIVLLLIGILLMVPVVVVVVRRFRSSSVKR